MFARVPAVVRHRFTAEEYYRMAETGVLKPEARVELLDGEILDLSPIEPLHGGTTNYLNSFFASQARGRWIVSVQNPVRLDEYSEPQPDLMLLRPATDFYRTRHPSSEDVFLLIEVADSTVEKDRSVKLPLYGRAGIPEVWIIDLQELTVEVYREPHLTGYGSSMVLRPGTQVAPGAFPDALLDLAALLQKG